MVVMEPEQLNGGRFYLRPLHIDDRIDDRPALARVVRDPQAFVEEARDSPNQYFWAVCEQTCVDMIALAQINTDTEAITITPIGNLDRVLPNDPVLPQVTVRDGMVSARGVIERWIAAQ